MIYDPSCTKSGVYWSWNGNAKQFGLAADRTVTESGKVLYTRQGAGGAGGDSMRTVTPTRECPCFSPSTSVLHQASSQKSSHFKSSCALPFWSLASPACSSGFAACGCLACGLACARSTLACLCTVFENEFSGMITDPVKGKLAYEYSMEAVKDFL